MSGLTQRIVVAAAVLTAPFCFAAPAAPIVPTAEDIAFFEKRIRPLLAEHCFDCHSGKKQKGGLRLDWRDGWAKGGASGPAIIPGKPDDSLLIKGVRHWDKDFKMPPEERLSPSLVNDLIEWVRRGAPDPRTTPPAAATATIVKPVPNPAYMHARKHWAFQPVKDSPTPAVRNKSWPRTNVDAFLLARMEQAGVTPTPDADRRTLIRRATFDLIGLPPTPEEVEAFINDTAPGAFARVVDRLLDSPHYGERWGRHWLDVVRYADTCGNASDYPVPQAYKYRNYVLRAFNADLPFNQFIREQLAGDLLPAATETERLERTIATGYLAIARHFGGGKGEPHLTIEDSIENMGRGFLGLSLNCARCHDHKFDPIPATDYYAIYGILSSAIFPHPGSEGMNRPKDLVPLLPKPELETANKVWKEKLAALDVEVKKLEAEKIAADKLPDSAEKKAKVDAAVKAVAAAKAQHKQFSETVPFEYAYAISEGKPANARLHVRGDPARLGEEVPRRFVEVLGAQPLPKDCGNSGRLDLANWIADPANPLTARVLVNRLWQHHFGRGLVTTPNDFGTRGHPPSHPELLDFLAHRFMQSGWSIKAMHRLLLNSRAWQMASGPATPESSQTFAANAARDTNNLLWWRADRRRLDAESIRDALLHVSGDLDVTIGGAHPFPPVHTWGFTQHNQFFAIYDNRQRTVYQMQQRLRRHPFLALFDGADPNASTAVREPSTTPLQSLFLMNDKFAHEQAAKFASRMQPGAADEARQIERAFLTLYARPPQPDEVSAAKDYLARFREKAVAKKLPAAEAWNSLSRALLSANEFLYLD